MARAAVSARQARRLIERPGPHLENFYSVYRNALSDVDSGQLASKARERCRHLAEELVTGSVRPENAPKVLREFVRTELYLRLAKQSDIWRLFTADGSAESFDERAFDESISAWRNPCSAVAISTSVGCSRFGRMLK